MMASWFTGWPPEFAAKYRSGGYWRSETLGEGLRGWWNVVVDPHFAAAFTARDLGDAGPDMDRRFEFAITYDRALAVEAARTLLARIARAR